VVLLQYNCDASIKTKKLYLPEMTVSLEIVLKNGSLRKFSPVSIKFDHFDQEILLSDKVDYFEKIQSGHSEIVKDDKIALIIEVQFTNDHYLICGLIN